MAPVPRQRQDWLPELVLALTSIANALADQEPTPERLAALGSRFANAVPGHQVQLQWLEHGYLYEPDIDEPEEPEYVVAISGDRLNAGWLIPAADLPDLLSLALSD